MCTFILESDTFSKCCHWHWRGGRTHCQHQVVIKRWRASQQSTTAGSCLVLFSWVTKTKGCSNSYLWAVFGHACSNHSPHLLIASCKMPRACPMLPLCQPVILSILLWSYGSTYLGSLLLFHLLLLLYTHQYRRMQSQWLFKWMQVWTNVSFLNIKQNPCVIFRIL